MDTMNNNATTVNDLLDLENIDPVSALNKQSSMESDILLSDEKQPRLLDLSTSDLLISPIKSSEPKQSLLTESQSAEFDLQMTIEPDFQVIDTDLQTNEPNLQTYAEPNLQSTLEPDFKTFEADLQEPVKPDIQTTTESDIFKPIESDLIEAKEPDFQTLMETDRQMSVESELQTSVEPDFKTPMKLNVRSSSFSPVMEPDSLDIITNISQNGDDGISGVNILQNDTFETVMMPRSTQEYADNLARELIINTTEKEHIEDLLNDPQEIKHVEESTNKTLEKKPIEEPIDDPLEIAHVEESTNDTLEKKPIEEPIDDPLEIAHVEESTNDTLEKEPIQEIIDEPLDIEHVEESTSRTLEKKPIQEIIDEPLDIEHVEESTSKTLEKVHIEEPIDDPLEIAHVEESTNDTLEKEPIQEIIDEPLDIEHVEESTNETQEKVHIEEPINEPLVKDEESTSENLEKEHIGVLLNDSPEDKQVDELTSNIQEKEQFEELIRNPLEMKHVEQSTCEALEKEHMEKPLNDHIEEEHVEKFTYKTEEKEHIEERMHDPLTEFQTSEPILIKSTVRKTTKVKFSNTKLSDILHWKDPIVTGTVFAFGMSIILSTLFFSIISVVAYHSLAIMLTSLSFRLYRSVMLTLNKKTPIDDIFEIYLSKDITLSTEKTHEIVDIALVHLNDSLIKLRNVLLLEDKIGSLKFAAILYTLLYVGSWFNGITLIFIAYLVLFSVPKVYELYKPQIDQYLNLLGVHASTTMSSVMGKVSSIASSATQSATSTDATEEKHKSQ